MGVQKLFRLTAELAQLEGYSFAISETHHTSKLDAPSGTAVVLGKIIEQFGGQKPPIESIREGEVVGTHSIELLSVADKITLTHEAHNRRGFAEGAVRAAEWVKGKHGFYEFPEVFSELKG